MTSIIAVILKATTPAVTILAFRRPVGHAAQLVAFRERRIRNTIQHGVGSNGRAPAIAGGDALDELDPVGFVRHVLLS